MLVGIANDLRSELAELSRSSKKLMDAIVDHNYLPEDFPTEQVRLIVSSLEGLVEGSFEGVRVPLEHSGVRLSEIRRRYFFHRDDSNTADDVRDDFPSLERGDALDAKFSEVLSDIYTCLDAYREQSRIEYVSTNIDEYINVLPPIDSSESSERRIRKNIDAIQVLHNSANRDDGLGGVHAEDIAMSSADARNALNSTLAEATSRYIIRGWIRRLSSRASTALKVLRKAIDTLSSGVGVANEFYNRYNSTVRNVRNVVIKEAQEWLDLVSRQIKSAEEKLKDFRSEDLKDRVGLIRSLGGQQFIVTADDIPFAISSDEKAVPANGTVVEFDLASSDGRPYARNVVRSNDYIIADRKVLNHNEALPVVKKIVENIISSEGKNLISVGQIRKKTERDHVLPSEYWRFFGYSSLGDFVTSIINVYSYPKDSPVEYISLYPIEVKPTDVLSVRDWCYNYLKRHQDGVTFGDLANAASKHFSMGIVPIRVQVNAAKFSDIVKADERFDIDGQLVRRRNRIANQ